MTEGTLAIYAPLAWFGPGRTVRDAAVVMDGGDVVFAGTAGEAPGAEQIIELDGFLMPAAADRHVHIRRSEPGAVLLGGVTAVRDLGWPADEIFDLADASELPSFNGPLIKAVGPLLTAPGGYGTNWGTGLEVRGTEDAAAAVGDLADRGAAAIKVAMNAEAGPTPSDSELATIVEVAHARSLPVTAHVQGAGQAERALGAGVDEFAHTPWTERLRDDLLHMAAKTLRMVSTLDIHSYGEITQELRMACDNLARFRAAGGSVVYGTDLGNGDIPPGIDLREVLLLHEAVRMTPEEVLSALIRAPLELGTPADMIGLADDPFDSLEALGELVMVVRAGRVVAATDSGEA